MQQEPQEENYGHEEEILQNINFNIDYEGENLLDPYGRGGVQGQNAEIVE